MFDLRSEQPSLKASESDLQVITEHLRENPDVLRVLDDFPVSILGVRMTLGQACVLLFTAKLTHSFTVIAKTLSDLHSMLPGHRVTGA